MINTEGSLENLLSGFLFRISDTIDNIWQELFYSSDIESSSEDLDFLRDYYLTMSNIDRSDYYNIKFQKKPLMAWIWISVIMIVVGGSLRLFSNAKNN